MECVNMATGYSFVVYISCVEPPPVADQGQIILTSLNKYSFGFIIQPSDMHLLYHIEYRESLLKDLLL
jgi:hypothetical protein